MLGDCVGPEDNEKLYGKVTCHCCALEVPWLLLRSAEAKKDAPIAER